MKLYLAGPMSGKADFNYPAFHAAAAELRAAGYEVVNPAEAGDDTSLPWAHHMRRDIKALTDCDGVVMLFGWTKSRGAKLEVTIAAALAMDTRSVKGWTGGEW